MKQSIWQDALADVPERGPLIGERKTDVLVVGGGMAGLLTAYMLKKKGIDCLLLEAGRVCSGNTGRTTAKITAQHGLVYAKLIREYGAIAHGASTKQTWRQSKRTGRLQRKFPATARKRRPMCTARLTTMRWRRRRRLMCGLKFRTGGGKTRHCPCVPSARSACRVRRSSTRLNSCGGCYRSSTTTRTPL